MSFIVSASGPKSDLGESLVKRFGETYPKPAPGVDRLFTAGVGVVHDFASHSSDEGNFLAVISGHANQNAGDARDSLSISIQPSK